VADVSGTERGVLTRLCQNRRGRIALVAILVLYAIALAAPVIAPYSPTAQPDVVGLKERAPSLAHPFGTDNFSRDVLSRLLYGARVSLSIATLAVLLSATLGLAYGVVSGYAGGRVDAAMMRLLDSRFMT